MNVKRKRVDYQDFHLVSNGNDYQDIDMILISIYSLTKLKHKKSLIFNDLCNYCLEKGDIFFPGWLLKNNRGMIKLIDLEIEEREITFNKNILEKMRVLKPNVFLILPETLNLEVLSYGVDVIYHYYHTGNLNPFQTFALNTLVFHQDENKLSKDYIYVLKRCLDFLPNVRLKRVNKKFLPWEMPNIYNDYDGGRALFWLKWIANLEGFWVNQENIEKGLKQLGRNILEGETKYLEIFTKGLGLNYYQKKIDA